MFSHRYLLFPVLFHVIHTVDLRITQVLIVQVYLYVESFSINMLKGFGRFVTIWNTVFSLLYCKNIT